MSKVNEVKVKVKGQRSKVNEYKSELTPAVIYYCRACWSRGM